MIGGRCEGCGKPAGTRRKTNGRWLCSACKNPGKQCGICLASGVKLKDGVCEDREACMERQPTLDMLL